MTASGKALWGSMSPKMKHGVTALAIDWKSRRARRIEAGLTSSSPEVSDDEDNTTMETVLRRRGQHHDGDGAPTRMVLRRLHPRSHASCAPQSHFNAAMIEVQFVPTPLSVFQQAHEEQRYNLLLLEQHRMAEGKIYAERASEDALVVMAAMNPNFVAEQRAIYDAIRSQAAVRDEAAAAEAQLQAIVKENNASCAADELSVGSMGRRQCRRHHFHRGPRVH
ncbi:Hydroxymethylglutaryl-CoA lyase, mitochondrial [Hordeum vulgare]|nr:Hydroxymethylglutaryl-CoA lyase, mitochondrial [Hordeum vulgare]